MINHEKVSQQIMNMSLEAHDTNDLHTLLSAIVFSVGGLVCFFPQKDRSEVLIQLTQMMGTGLQITAKNIGEPSEIEIVVGRSDR